MKTRRTLGHRLTSLLLCLAMMLSFIPAGLFLSAAAATQENRVVDDHTLDQWMQYFGLQTGNAQNVQISTEYAGGIWTDKSVFLPGNLPSQLTNALYNGRPFPLTDKKDNFLVALSAIASNKEIKGYSTIPTDTVLVLDLSSSMRYTDDNGGSAIDELVTATNKAITDLLGLNKNNRIAVVIYAGNDNKSFSSADGLTQVVLPLDSYTAPTNGAYLVSRPVGNSADRAIEVASGVKNSAGTTISNNRFEVSTGTFMQDGIYEAMRLLLNADTVVQEGVQSGTNRLPIMVLMTDGEPTLANSDYNGNNNRTDLGVSDLNDYSGSTGTHSHRDTIAFMTSLTAAFANKQISAHYGTDALIYTLAYGNSVLSRPEALSVMNPAAASDVQLGLWQDFLDGKEVTVYRTGSRNNYRYIKVKNASVAGETLTATDRLYVDKYFPAGNDDAMLGAFEDIVEEIIIQSKYYPTYVEKDHDHDGYLTFADKIGTYMEVSDIKGIIIGNRLFSGAALASNFNIGSLGTVESPNALGDELVRSVKARLGIESTAVAQALLQNAFDHGQFRYVSDQDFSCYIGWFSDANGNYVDFWHENMTDDQIAAAVSQKNATHIIRSYGFLGDTTDIPGVSNTDMMYMSVRVATAISTGETTVIWQIPASLVPTITYEVEVEVNSDGKITGITDLTVESGTAETPIRLVYEVELRSDITDWNLTQKISPNYSNTHGYTFYSNKWSSNANDTVLNTYSHFEPSVQNERYYYTQDTEVLAKNGDTYTPVTGGTKPSGEGYYHAYQVFEKLVDGQLRLHTHYEPISTEALASAVQNGNQWVIPKDTVHRYYDYEISPKDENLTGTMGYSDHPFVIKDNNTYYTYSTQGNNGRLTLTPATGFKLTKKLAAGFSSDATFTFLVEGNLSGAQVIRLDDNGNEASRTPLPASGEVTLIAGETVYIIGLTPGSYTVSEKIPVGADYRVRAVSVNGIAVNGTTATFPVAAQTIPQVEFTNDLQGYGSLIVSKEVNYPAGFAPADAHHQRSFTINVEFFGSVAGMLAPAGAVATGNIYTITLKDGDSVTFSNIPEGVTYAVTESNLPAGYQNTAIRYSNAEKAIVAQKTEQVHVVNNYTTAPTSANITIRGNKTVTGGWPANASFTVRLWEVIDFSSGNAIDTGLTATVTESASGYTIDMSSIVFDKVGTYNFQVEEDIPENRIPDMAYDRSYGLFSVTVTDLDADGVLEVASVESYQNTQLTGSLQNGFVVTKDFTNVVTKDIIYVDVSKEVVDASDETKHYTGHLADITFGLFDSLTAQTPAYYVITDGQGKATFAVPVTQDGLGAEGKTFYLREIAPAAENRVVGMHYNENWIAAIQITWDDTAHEAVVQYAPMDNTTVGTFVPYNRASVTFIHTNTYTPGETTAELVLSGIKTLNGTNNLGGRTFRFSLYRTTAAFVIQETLQTVENNGNAIRFSGITFDTPGMHYLSVKEEASTLGGITVDQGHYHISVLVEKYVDTDGVTRLRVADGYPYIVRYGEGDAQHTVAADQLNFNNLYTITGTTSVTITGNKTLTGRPMQGGEFSFRLVQVADANGTALPGGLAIRTENGAANNGTAKFQFAPITYSQAGTYYYQITEIPGASGNGVTYSTASFIVKVTVADNGVGGYTSSWEVVGGGSITFANTYKPQNTYLDITGMKELSGKELADKQFSFQLVQTQSDFATALNGGVSETVQNDFRGVIAFSRLHYAQAGTYYYVIREQIPASPEPGITYDKTEYRITVTVTDDGSGQLKASASAQMVIINGQTSVIPTSSIVFSNIYTVTGNATVTLEGTKNLVGQILQDGMFSFQLFQTGSNYATNGVTPTTAVNQNGKFQFALTYSPADIGKTFYYLVQEKDAGKVINGITYSSASYKIKVEVADDGKGGVKTIVTADGLTVTGNKVSGMAFENRYNVTGNATVTLEGTKNLVGQILQDGMFSFQLFETGSNYATEGVTPTTVVNQNGKFQFALTYSPADIGKTFYYLVQEKDAGKTINGITYSSASYKIKVEVMDDGKGGVKTIVTAEGLTVTDNKVSGMAFENRYNVTGNATVTLEGTKNLVGQILQDGMFSFQLFETGSNYATEGVTPTTVVNQNGKFQFALTYSPADIGKTFYYLVQEKDAGKVINGITYSSASYKIKVEVADDGKGGVKTIVTAEGLTVTDNKVSGMAFENRYATTGTQAQIGGSKELLGGKLNGDDFRFHLYQTDSTFTISGLVPVGTQLNGADGSFLFDSSNTAALVYTEAGIYYYVLVEDASSPKADIRYDTTVYQFKVTVIDNGKGGLEATVECVSHNGNVVFRNVYHKEITKKEVFNASEPTINIDGKLVKKGDVLTYTISYTNYTGAIADITITDIIPAHTVYVTGSATQGGILDGTTLTWELVNIAPGETVSVSFQVEVADEDKTILNQAAVLEGSNTYRTNTVTSAVPGNDNPATGDGANLQLWAMMMLFSCGAVVSLLAFGKKEKEN